MELVLKFSVIVILGIVFYIHSASAWSGNVCSRGETYYVRERYCIYGTWMGCCAWGYRTVCRYRTIQYCCSGWRHLGNYKCTDPVCSPNCANGGTCSSPNVCSCTAGYEGPRCNGLSCVSHLQRCYPGYCNNNNCQCANKFGGSECLTFTSDDLKPSIDQCTTTFRDYSRSKQMMMYEYTVDATRAAGKEDVWVNQNSFNQLRFQFNVDFDYFTIRDTVIPFKPGYVKEFKIGVVDIYIDASQTRLPLNEGGSRDSVFNKTYPCDSVAVSNTNPEHNKVLECTIDEDNFIYNLQSGDRLKFTFSAKSGGYRDVINVDAPNTVYKQDIFIGKLETKEMEFFLDFENPTHCSESTCAKSADLNNSLFVVHDITKTAIQTRWSGWLDKLGGVFRYAWEIFKLEPEEFSKKLKEPNPLGPIKNVGINHTDDSKVYEYEFTPPSPGMYSIILEIADKANNTRYVRRYVLYDPDSKITINGNDKLYVNSAHKETSYAWQSVIGDGPGGATNVYVAWPNHFTNKFHEDNFLLNDILDYPPQLEDGGRRQNYKKIDSKFEDNEGKRQKTKIPNIHGIVKFEIVARVDKRGGTTHTTIPGSGWKTLSPIAENTSVLVPGIEDGKSAKIFVRATDAMGNTKVDTTVVHFDTSVPNIYKAPEIVNNIKNGAYPFSSRVTVYGRDLDSGVHKLHWKLIMTSNNFEKMNGDVPNVKQTADACINTPCYQVPMGDHYLNYLTFDINHCWMRVPKAQLDTLVMDLEIAVINFAMLNSTVHLNISNIRELHGIEDYAGPKNIKMTNQLDKGVSLTWEHAPSCYDRDVILIIVYMPDGTEKTLRADRDAERFDITGLDPETSYNIELMTVYKDGGPGTIDSTISKFVIVTVESDGLSGGAIAGIVIALLLILILVGIGILLWRTGRLEKLLHRGERSPSIKNDLHSVERSPNNQTLANYQPRANKNVYDNEAFSGNKRLSRSHDEDNIYYGGLDLKETYHIARKHVSLEDEIKRGKFAVIYRAQWYSDKPDPQVVVAKVLKENASGQDIMAMKAKINFYATEVGEHPHVLKFIGAVEDEHLGSFMLLEYCECGTLKEYLSSKQHQVTEDVQDKIYRFAFDVCKGMEYLAGRGIVHRRLAARNILLNFLHTIKISGFGPMPNEDGPDDQGERLPVKWLPPECIEANSTRDATKKCDVWSYGIVLWEIFSMGDTPYPEVRGRDLLSYLKRGERMKKPEYSDGKMYDIMKKCWRTEVGKRPTFKKILSEMESLFVTSGDDDYYYDSKAIYDNRK